MGIFNLFNTQGALEDGQEFRDARQGALISAEDYAAQNPYFAAQNQGEETLFNRTMLPVMQEGVQQVNELGQPLYETPERQVYLKNAQYIQGLENKANADFERKVNNPLFKIGDFAADLFRNTIAAPINLITGENGFHVDPSKSTVEGYKSRLLELDELRGLNQQLFIGGRDKRAEAFSDAVGSRINDITPSHYTTDSIANFKSTGDYDDLVRYNNFETITDPNTGEIYQLNKATNEKIVIKSADQAQADKLAQIAAENFTKVQSEFINGQTAQASRLQTAKNKTQTLQGNIQNAIAIINKYPQATGWGDLLSRVPSTEAAQLKAVLDTVKANVAFTALQEMRANSPTGGALGNVSNVEIELLYQSLAPILQKGSPKQLIESLLTIEKTAADTLSIYERAYNEDLRYFGGREDFSMNPTEGADKKTGGATAQNIPEGYDLMEDANGNKAYVNSNGDIIEVN